MLVAQDTGLGAVTQKLITDFWVEVIPSNVTVQRPGSCAKRASKTVLFTTVPDGPTVSIFLSLGRYEPSGDMYLQDTNVSGVKLRAVNVTGLPACMVVEQGGGVMLAALVGVIVITTVLVVLVGG